MSKNLHHQPTEELERLAALIRPGYRRDAVCAELERRAKAKPKAKRTPKAKT